MLSIRSIIYIIAFTIMTLLYSCFDSTNSDKKAINIYKLKLAESWPSNFPILGDHTKRVAKLVKEMSNSRLQIDIYSSNYHKNPLGVFTLVKSGEYDLGHTVSYYHIDKEPSAVFFTSMPFGMTTTEQHAWFEYGGGQELMDRVYAPHGLKAILGGNGGNQMGGWFKQEINTLDDLKGLKMRIQGLAGKIMAELGVIQKNIPPEKIYSALGSGTVDAVEWIGPSLDLLMGFYKIAPYYYTGWHEPAGEAQFLINLEKFNKLPKDLQIILTTAMKASAHQMYIDNFYNNARDWHIMKTKYSNIKIKVFPSSVIKALKKANDALLSELASNSKIAEEIINSQKQYLVKARDWTNISDRSYLNLVIE